MSDLNFKYRRMSEEERVKLIKELRGRLEGVEGIVFAYVHGGFLEVDVFRDVDVAVWVGEGEEAFKYEVDLSARLGGELGVPIDIRVLNGAPLPFRYHVFSRGRLLFSKDEGLRFRVVDEAVRMYADLKMLRGY
jgi:hypothetical protein